ncbi:unnamed protein product [Effrenium voratum]|uniref:Uncharacterized protein n=1 Tax=Effrenium voratum TaxID=2562239 RepID=A0AA36NCS8_9DINO|nr:unnamed protein product [Effrenium voratum]
MKGDIRPTDRDQFLVKDKTIGPSVYTVTEQFIKPVTLKAGSVSWALLKHPDGLRCDVFVTHAWSEGIYEFIDKVEYSYPPGATGCYVCFLSNPQNLDISDLIQSPQESPFAKALHASSSILVVTNQVSSIYTRIWCVYEAFLGYTLDKQIRTARSPLRLLPDMLAVSGTGLAALGALILILIEKATFKGFHRSSVVYEVEDVRRAGFVSTAVSVGAILFLFLMKKHGWITCQLAMYVFSMCLAVFLAADICLKGFTSEPALSAFFIAVFALPAVEGDRLRAAEANRQAQLLRQGFTDTVRNATSSNPVDLNNILVEIEQSGQLNAVDETVKALQAMNLSTRELRQVTKRVGPLGNCSGWSRATFTCVCGLLVFQFVQIKKYRIDEYGPRFPLMTPPAISWVLLSAAALEAIVWPVMFCCLPVERKSFSARCCVFLLLLLPGIFGVVWTGRSYDMAANLAIIPFVLFLCILGPGRISLVPCGPALLRLLFGRRPWGSRDPDPKASDSPGPMDVPRDVPIDVHEEPEAVQNPDAQGVQHEEPDDALSSSDEGNTPGYVVEVF